jgi:hypothetical protein
MNCKELKIELCGACKYTATMPCWVIHYKVEFGRLNNKKAITEYIIKYNLCYNNEIFYMKKAAELYYPHFVDTIEIAMLLQ